MSLDDLIADLTEQLRADGVQFVPWTEAVAMGGGLDERQDLLAVLWAPYEGVPAQITVTPIENPQLHLLALRYAQTALQKRAAGDESAFQSWDALHERAVALIYGRAAD